MLANRVPLSKQIEPATFFPFCCSSGECLVIAPDVSIFLHQGDFAYCLFLLERFIVDRGFNLKLKILTNDTTCALSEKLPDFFMWIDNRSNRHIMIDGGDKIGDVFGNIHLVEPFAV